MTPAELDYIRLAVKIEAMKVLIRGLYTGLANMSPTAAQGFRDKFGDLREEHRKIALKGFAPEVSDLLAGEYQEALDDLLTYVEAGFH